MCLYGQGISSVKLMLWKISLGGAMMDDTSIFGAKPDHLDQLLRLALEPPETEDQAAPPASLDTIAEKPGGRIDKYKLLSVLGEGGMGIVYLAQQEEPIRRQVALKVIKPGMDSKRVIARFEVEEQALALMQHAHIAGVYDVGMTLTGRSYFVMEYVKGMPITDYCDDRRLTIKDRLGLFLQVCRAVQHAHQKGIIHRDIKPSNILVSVENDRPTPKIIDFGVAKAIGRPLTDRTVFTEDSHLLGTPEYMSPEQADMATEDIDTRSDVYSLGVLLYVLLTGVLPFDAEALRESGIEKIRKTIRETDPKTPSTRLTNLGEEAAKVAEMRGTEISKLARNLKKELEWIPLKAMRKDRSERYRSASELADDIENYLNGAPLIAGPPTTLYRLNKSVRRHKALMAGTLAVLIVSIVGTIISAGLAIGQARARADAEAIATFLKGGVLEAIKNVESYEVTISDVFDTISVNIEGKFADQPLVEASLRNTLGWTYHNLSEWDKAERHLERSLQLYEDQFGEDHPRTIELMHNLGWVYSAHNREEDAHRLWSKALAIVRRKGGEEGALNNALGCLCSRMGKHKEAERLFLESLGGDWSDDVTVGYAGGNLARVYLHQGRYDEAEQLFLKMPGITKAEQEDPGKLQYTTTLAELYQKQGREDDAQELYKINLERQRERLGDRHIHTRRTMTFLAQLYKAQGNYEAAEPLLREALEHHRLDSVTSTHTRRNQSRP
jgi:serine/threonine protein kinase